MSKLDKDTVINEFSKAYAKKNGEAPKIEEKGGWYSVNGGKNKRLAQLAGMISLVNEASELNTENESNLKKQSGTQKTRTFCVKDFYTQQILEINNGAKAPR